MKRQGDKVKQYLLHITPISPIHIGTGEELLPFSYIIKDINPKHKDYRFIRFNDTKLIQLLNEEEKAKFLQIAKKGELSALRQFFIEIANNAVAKNQSIILSLSEITDDMLYLWNDLEEHPQNSFIVRPTIATPRAGKALVPYIPGSSLKGAIRTAVMDVLDDSIRKEQKGVPQKDPFRTLVITDAYFDGKGTRLVGSAVLYNRKTKKIANLEMFYEVIKGQAITEHPPEATCVLSINTELQKLVGLAWEMPDLPEIARRCKEFYLNLLDEEYKTYYESADDTVYSGFKVIDDQIGAIEKKENEFVIRLGMHSQFEYMTFNSLRRCENPKYDNSSRTLFKYKNLYLPMGWVHIQFEHIKTS
jgi:CRISPR-associated protein Csm5